MVRHLVVVVVLCAFSLTPIAASAQGIEAKGEAVFGAQKCLTCHALNGKGMAKGPLDGVGTKLSADDIREWILRPDAMAKKTNATRKPPMRAYGQLPQSDLDALVAFLVSKKK